MNKEQQCRTSKKDVKLLRDIFFNKQSFRRCPEIPCVYCVCLLLSPCRTEVAILSTNQQTACVASDLPAGPGTLSGVSVPQRRSTVRRVRINTDHAHFWGWKRDLCRTFADWTDPHPPVEMCHTLVPCRESFPSTSHCISHLARCIPHVHMFPLSILITLVWGGCHH